MKAMERRLARLRPAIARLHPPPRPPIEETRLTAGEGAEARRIGEITKVGGLDALSVDELELLECLVQKAAGEEVGACLG
jgi:hypothetical protein